MTPPPEMSLDQYLEDLRADRLLEATPRNLRLRTRILERARAGREEKRAKEALSVG